MPTRQCDVAIIGAGTAGLAAERSARRGGAKTLLIDPQFSGTTCATVGCMPSKLLIAAAKAAHAVEGAKAFGIEAENVHIHGPAVLERVRRLRDEFVAATLKSIEEIPSENRLRGKARFADQTVLDVDCGADQDAVRIEARAVVIATGSSPSLPPAFVGLDHVLTNETLFEMPDLPSSLAVIGAGPLGLELAQALSRLGVDVAVFDEGDSIAGLHDEDVARSMRTILEREMPFHMGVSVKPRDVGDGIELSWSGASSGTRHFARVLVATGRPPNLKDLDLKATGLALDDHGTPKFDRTTMQCGSAPIFMAGDADAEAPVLHEASSEGAIAGYNAARFPQIEPSHRTTALAITFTDPPSATIGAPRSEETIVGTADYGDQGRAKAENRAEGMVRLYADRQGLLTGACMAAPEAEHFAHLITWAIENRQTAMQLLKLPLYHPTFEEGLRQALRQICKQTGEPVGGDQDEGSAAGA